MEGVRLLGRWGEAVAQHDGDEAMDALRRALGAEVERLGWSECFPEDHHCLHVGFLKGLAHNNIWSSQLGAVLNLLRHRWLQSKCKQISPPWLLQTKGIPCEDSPSGTNQQSSRRERNLSPWLRSLSGILDPLIWRELWLDPPQTLRAPPDKNRQN